MSLGKRLCFHPGKNTQSSRATCAPGQAVRDGLSSVGSGPLFTWLAELETDHGLSICSLGVTENTDATLNATRGPAC